MMTKCLSLPNMMTYNKLGVLCMIRISNKMEKSNFGKVSFTGHRPKSLPWGYDENKQSCVAFKKVMYEIIEKAIVNNFTYFITGMALGVDMICAEIVLGLKNKYKDVQLECAIPCLNQEKRWLAVQQRRYNDILNKADYITYVNKNEYTEECMNERNKYMVDNSDVVIAVWNGKPSGTGNTVLMAKNSGKKIRVVNPYEPK